MVVTQWNGLTYRIFPAQLVITVQQPMFVQNKNTANTQSEKHA